MIRDATGCSWLKGFCLLKILCKRQFSALDKPWVVIGEGWYLLSLLVFGTKKKKEVEQFRILRKAGRLHSSSFPEFNDKPFRNWTYWITGNLFHFKEPLLFYSLWSHYIILQLNSEKYRSTAKAAHLLSLPVSSIPEMVLYLLAL